MDILARLRDTRRSLGISQEALGKRLRITQAHLSDIEKAKVTPRLSSVIEIARALDQELILVPRNKIPMIRAILAGRPAAPLWEIGDEEEEEV
jgi:transcriptional regulator with XRE-family HTH domain